MFEYMKATESPGDSRRPVISRSAMEQPSGMALYNNLCNMALFIIHSEKATRTFYLKSMHLKIIRNTVNCVNHAECRFRCSSNEFKSLILRLTL